MRKNKLLRNVILVLIPALLILCGVIFYRWNRYCNKNNLISKYVVDNVKDVYVLGTIGKKHFNKINHYSMEDLLSAIDNIDPDLVLITAREDHYLQNNVIDGDIDTCVTYSYCFEHDIPVKMVDWWMVDNIYPKIATTNLRDDNIFIKINRFLKDMRPGSKTLIVCSSDHYYEQTARCSIAGFESQKIDDKKEYFISRDEDFEFPRLASKIWKDRLYFYAYTFPKLLEDNEFLAEEAKKTFLTADHDRFYRQGITYCTYLNNDILYK